MLYCDEYFFHDKFNYFYNIGKKDVDKHDSYAQERLENYITEDILDGTAIQDNWFPQIHCDIFISHSHEDRDLATALAGWLWEKFELKAFVDSSIWGYANDLIDILLEETDDNYPHNERNNSDLKYITSHVHNMLNVALMNMIEKSKCLFFLNTPNFTILDGIKTYTLSPWIYTELEISKILSQHPMQISDSRIAHELDLSHLTEIDYSDLNEWEESNTQGDDALYTLYGLTS